MSDTPRMSASQPAAGPGATGDFRPQVIVCYSLFLLVCVNGLTAIIGVAIAHARRREAECTVWQGHFENLIVVFRVFVPALLIAMLNSPLGIWAAVRGLSSRIRPHYSSGRYLVVFLILF